MEVSTEDILSEEVEPIKGTYQQLGATSMSEEFGSVSGESGVVAVLEEPTSDAADRGMTTSGEAPAISPKMGSIF